MNEDKPLPNTLLTTQEVAKLLKTSEKTVYRLVQRGKLPKPFQLSDRCLRFDPSEVVEFLRRSREASA
jgi:prophage regulatory protein